MVTIPSIVREDRTLLYLLANKWFLVEQLCLGSSASDNVMPAKVAQALGLTLTKIFGHCYYMENKQVSLIGQIKNAQFAFATYPKKKIKMTILVADVSASYRMLLGRNFFKDVDGKLNMDMTKARIPIKGVVQKLVPERETKYTFVKSNDLHAQILFESVGFGNYYLHIDKVSEFVEDWPSSGSETSLLLASDRFVDAEEDQTLEVGSFDSYIMVEDALSFVANENTQLTTQEEEARSSSTKEEDAKFSFHNAPILDEGSTSHSSEANNSNDVWTLEFDGSCATNGFRASAVLISPKGDIFPYYFKLQFSNTSSIRHSMSHSC